MADQTNQNDSAKPAIPETDQPASGPCRIEPLRYRNLTRDGRVPPPRDKKESPYFVR